MDRHPSQRGLLVVGCAGQYLADLHRVVLAVATSTDVLLSRRMSLTLPDQLADTAALAIAVVDGLEFARENGWPRVRILLSPGSAALASRLASQDSVSGLPKQWNDRLAAAYPHLRVYATSTTEHCPELLQRRAADECQRLAALARSAAVTVGAQ